MRIAIGKIGKSIKFGPEEKGTGKKAMTAGSIDARIIFQTLIKFNPQDTFYLIGRSNFSRFYSIFNSTKWFRSFYISPY